MNDIGQIVFGIVRIRVKVIDSILNKFICAMGFCKMSWGKLFSQSAFFEIFILLLNIQKL